MAASPAGAGYAGKVRIIGILNSGFAGQAIATMKRYIFQVVAVFE
jgi:hypothetical protein